MAEQGFAVDAVDIAEEGLALVQRPAPRRSGRSAPTWTPLTSPPARYDLIVNTLYLNRRLFPQIREGLQARRPADFRNPARDRWARRERREHCRDYFLRPNELLHSFLSLRVLHYHEESGSRPG
ncbi:MAG: hypothetical protein MZV70_28800 [Desulfobacterales bacterium]|nr:hypothetical protein [Desulfobacterales bacterium]